MPVSQVSQGISGMEDLNIHTHNHLGAEETERKREERGCVCLQQTLKNTDGGSESYREPGRLAGWYR